MKSLLVIKAVINDCMFSSGVHVTGFLGLGDWENGVIHLHLNLRAIALKVRKNIAKKPASGVNWRSNAELIWMKLCNRG